MAAMKTFALLAVLAVTCQAVAGRQLLQAAPTTVYQALSSAPQFSTLYAAVNRVPDLINGLNNPATAVTIFAPTNAAFTSFLNETGLTAPQLLGLQNLDRVLEYHVVPFAIASDSLTNGRTLETLLGSSATWTLTVQAEQLSNGAKNIFVNGLYSDAMVISPFDLKVGNTYIHAIDSVLVPPVEVQQGQSTTTRSAVSAFST